MYGFHVKNLKSKIPQTIVKMQDLLLILTKNKYCLLFIPILKLFLRFFNKLAVLKYSTQNHEKYSVNAHSRKFRS